MTNMTLVLFRNLAISIGIYLFAFLILYFVIKWAVKNGVKEAFRDMKGITSEEEYVEHLQKGFDKKESTME